MSDIALSGLLQGVAPPKRRPHSGPDVGGKQTFGVRIEECTQNPPKN